MLEVVGAYYAFSVVLSSACSEQSAMSDFCKAEAS